MKRPVVTVPRSILRLTAMDWDIDWRGQSTASSNAGISQKVFNRFPLWMADLSMILSGDEIRVWRAFRAAAQGRFGVYRLPMTDPVGYDATPVSVGFAGGQKFASGQGFAAPGFVVCPMGAAAGSTEIIVDDPSDRTAQGMFLSHDNWPFIVTSRRITGQSARLGVQMPLRRAIPAGGRVLLRAVGLFEAVDDRTGSAGYDLSRAAVPSLQLREWINRP